MAEQKINKIKVGTQVYNLESSSAGNYLPLSGGTMTGSIVQNSDFNILAEAFTGGDGYFNLCKGFDLYDANGKNFAYLNSNGNFILYNKTTESEGLSISPTNLNIYDQWDNNATTSLFNTNDTTSVSSGNITLYHCNNEGEQFANVVLYSYNYGIITLGNAGENSVVISGAQSGDADGYARVDLYDDSQHNVVSLDSVDGLLFNRGSSNANKITSNGLTLRLWSNYNLFHRKNNADISILDESNAHGQLPRLAIALNNGSTLTAGYSDFNQITTPGFYYCTQNDAAQKLGNRPTQYAFNLLVTEDCGICQILKVFNGGGIFTRAKLYKTSADTAWTAWKHIPFAGEDSSYVKKSGDTMTGSLTVPAVYQTSDIRKKNIIGEVPIDKCYDMLDKCQEIIYTLKDQTKEQIGLIAQEVEGFFPEVINTDAEGYKSLDYAKLVVVCLKLIKDLSDRISKLEKDG